MGVHDTHSGAQPDQPTEDTLVEGRARLYDIEDYEGPDVDATDLDRAFWLTDCAKSAIGLMFIKNRHQSHLLLAGSFTVTRDGEFMVARPVADIPVA